MWYFDEIVASTDDSGEWSVDDVEYRCCAACGSDVAELWLATPKDLRGALVALVDEDDDAWCVDCFFNWCDNDDNDDDGTPNKWSCCFRRQTAGGNTGTCSDCEEWLPPFGAVWDWHGGTYCEACFDEYDDAGGAAAADDDDSWDGDSWDDSWDGSWDCPDDAEWAPACVEWAPVCAECDSTLSGSAYVVNNNESCYCFPCWTPRQPDQADANGRTLTAAEAANTQRNESNIAKLRAWYPQHCAYHVYFHHVRGREHGCKYGDAHKCTRGSHAAPPGLALKARGLDLDVEPAVRAGPTQPLASRHPSLTAP